jgi:hypothetical protein
MRSAWGCTVLLLGVAPAYAARDVDYAAAMRQIGADITTLKSTYPQLADFAYVGANTLQLEIDYSFHTHQPERRGGWTSGVPNPDADGVWFFIDLHDADSTAQIHTQPMTAPLCLGDKRVSLLILEGTQTKRLSGALGAILQRHGARPCGRDTG